jgi:hypothetical protein
MDGFARVNAGVESPAEFFSELLSMLEMIGHTGHNYSSLKKERALQ